MKTYFRRFLRRHVRRARPRQLELNLWPKRQVGSAVFLKKSATTHNGHAVALVRPTKSIYAVDLAAVKKRMKDKDFARAVNRDDIVRRAEGLGMPLDDVIANVITAPKSDAERLGIAGSPIS